MALGLSAAAADADGETGRPAVEDLRVGYEGEGIRVSYRVSGVFNDEVLERVQSGMRLSFEHRVVLLGNRIAPLLPRETVGKTVVVTSVRYDSLTRRYEMERSVTGKSWPKGETPPDLVEQRSTSSPEEMEAWLTRLEDVPLPGPTEPGQRLKVRVRTDLGIRFLLMFLPWPNTVAGEAWLEP